MLEYGRETDFTIFVDDQPVTMKDIPGEEYKHEANLKEVGSVRLIFKITDGKQPLKNSGMGSCHCDEHASNPTLDRQDRMAHRQSNNDSPLCVQAIVDDVRAQRSATVVVELGTDLKGVSSKPILQLVSVQDQNGASHRVNLIDLPAVMRSWRLRRPRIRDLPQPLGTVA